MPTASEQLSGLIVELSDWADEWAALGKRNVEGAMHASRLMLIEAAFEDGIELNADQLGFDFGVVDV
ncbi:hypothetical protein KK141_09255 [Dyella sp. LX-66]|uniref:hypothetical protein n=1 Tax=unclassified Dyella TaxID=2634549 RepID=UPI001BE114E3|nr:MULTISPECIES: hypothetical protein [unclassified Dyella]MBT2117204.1 hypothetical protein [Dyella sp. LX-1]MBT2139720.1 hypothetical protein [Dyella sp. LX-66]